jgi:hypothetical protein
MGAATLVMWRARTTDPHCRGANTEASRVSAVGVRAGVHRRLHRCLSGGDKRGPAAVAATLYTETPESISGREQDTLERRVAKPLGADLRERPSKRDRRRLEALRRAGRTASRDRDAVEPVRPVNSSGVTRSIGEYTTNASGRPETDHQSQTDFEAWLEAYVKPAFPGARRCR